MNYSSFKATQLHRGSILSGQVQLQLLEKQLKNGSYLSGWLLIRVFKDFENYLSIDAFTAEYHTCGLAQEKEPSNFAFSAAISSDCVSDNLIQKISSSK